MLLGFYLSGLNLTCNIVDFGEEWCRSMIDEFDFDDDERLHRQRECDARADDYTSNAGSLPDPIEAQFTIMMPTTITKIFQYIEILQSSKIIMLDISF